MLRKAEELLEQTREAYETFVMNSVDEAASHCDTSVCMAASDVPSWLVEKLRRYGYKVCEGDRVSISWGCKGAEQLF